MKRYLNSFDMRILFALAGLVLLAFASLDLFTVLMHDPGLIIAPVTLAGLRQRKADAIRQAEELHESAGDESMSEEDQEQYDGFMEEARSLQTRIEQAEELAEMRSGLGDVEESETVETSDDDPIAPELRGSDRRGEAGEALRFGQASIAWRRRAVRLMRAHAFVKENKEASDRLFRQVRQETQERSDAQIRAEHEEARQILRESGLNSYRQMIGRHVLGIGEFRLLSTEDGATGGGDHLIPRPMLAEIFVLTEQYGVARRICRVIPWTGAGNTLDLSKVVSKVTAAWVDQGAMIPASDITFDEDRLSLKKLAGITSYSHETEEDVALPFIPVTVEAFAEAIAEKEDDAAFNGDGSSTYGGFTGVLGLSGAQTTVLGGTAASDITEDKLREAKNAVSMNKRGRARWLMHETVMDEIRKLENGAGFRLFTESLAEGGSVNLLGYPVTFSEKVVAATAISGNDTPVIAFGDFSRYFMALKRGMTMDVSREAVLQDGEGAISYNAFQADGALLRVTERVGFKTPAPYEAAFSVIQTAAA